ncbi:hypothetical protein EXU85_19825 [Spirosoma sp. KCTC 42546]|uniref:hypothetical protein n=1 Tax=Spirosoma sp. KCTC 42546 TaxID=2520506 RepID=UPI0011584124|nr:hypothetical protein [Spirosoma sp. KCTC 42546]QDK80734.1 hypothetical protein EXU85_19825 [Spirosoma sp. KCTC 42546]
MNSVISPGDRVSVEKTVKGFFRGLYMATVIHWTSSGRLKVKLDGSGMVKIVSPENVRKIADKSTDVDGSNGLTK